jgi:hypothetical protein
MALNTMSFQYSQGQSRGVQHFTPGKEIHIKTDVLKGQSHEKVCEIMP